MDNNEDTTVSLSAQRQRRVQRFTPEQREAAQAAFLKAFSMTANVRAACMAAGIHRSTVYSWREHDEAFAIEFHEASEEANDVIRGELFRRAIQGVEKPVVSVGKLVYVDGKPLTVREYSDHLLSLLAKARMPEFRDKQSLDVNANVNARVESTNLLRIDVRALSSEQLAKLKELAADMRDGGDNA